MKVYALVDWMGTMGMTQDEEYAQIEKDFQEIVEKPFRYKTNVYPWKLENDPVDFYILDFGGVLPGAEDSVKSIYRDMIKQVEEKPNTLFILWSTFSQRWYQEIIENDFPELTTPPNVVFLHDENAHEMIKMWAETS